MSWCVVEGPIVKMGVTSIWILYRGEGASIYSLQVQSWSDGEVQFLLFDLFKAFDKIESSPKSGVFFRQDSFSFVHAQRVLSYNLYLSN